MTTRYFKASDGERTYFRATKNAYIALRSDRYNHRGWSTVSGEWPAVAITKAEYEALVALKKR
jgi:hypothetical protein